MNTFSEKIFVNEIKKYCKRSQSALIRELSDAHKIFFVCVSARTGCDIITPSISQSANYAVANIVLMKMRQARVYAFDGSNFRELTDETMRELAPKYVRVLLGVPQKYNHVKQTTSSGSYLTKENTKYGTLDERAEFRERGRISAEIRENRASLRCANSSRNDAEKRKKCALKPKRTAAGDFECSRGNIVTDRRMKSNSDRLCVVRQRVLGF